jgi:hypothetical protein
LIGLNYLDFLKLATAQEQWLARSHSHFALHSLKQRQYSLALSFPVLCSWQQVARNQ